MSEFVNTLRALEYYKALNKDMLKFDEDGNLLVADTVIELLSNALASKAQDALLVDINKDDVGIAKDSTLSKLTEALKSAGADKLLVALSEDDVGIAKDTTLGKLVNALASVGIDKILVGISEDDVGIAKDATANNILNELLPVKAGGSITAADNTSGLIVTLNKGGRPYVNLKYNVGGACKIYVEVSDDGNDWYELDYIVTDSATKKVEQYPWVGDSYIRARSPTTGIDITFKLMAGR